METPEMVSKHGVLNTDDSVWNQNKNILKLNKCLLNDKWSLKLHKRSLKTPIMVFKNSTKGIYKLQEWWFQTFYLVVGDTHVRC